ncbi:flagellar hook-associated protein FlgK [uncultured Flavonifractor sp.]|uniref:flagellar hook-associated protein FlgK n=1 Tax=uncultured Flavonifractor sp. TaxID=1193534 RepID=UPI00261E34AA|nr:flagellar hook-associated protein FlgK [uncultured Flavonifractor sp.]
MGTFGSFTTVRLGIYSAQKGLDVTGNNITNINTEGYTRQRLNQVSLIPSVNDRYYSSYNTRIGQGAVVAGITQVRDPGLDISYRKANSDVGSANAKLDGLNQIATILDEVGKGSLDQDDGVILSQLNDIRDLISQAITNGVDTYDPLIRESADALCTFFNSYADKLTELQKTYEDKLNQQVTEVNDILTQIRDLNESIRNADLRGDPALELRDNRNNLLDKLSGYVKIDVKYTMEEVGPDTEVEKMTVSIVSNEGHTHTLVDGVYGTQLSCDNNNNYTISISDLTDANGVVHPDNAALGAGTDMVDNDLYGSIQSIREILTEKGEFSSQNDVDNVDPDALVKRGIPYYQKALDSLAYEFATAMNELNHVYDSNGNLVAGAGNLFSIGSNTNDAVATDPVTGAKTQITASNISVSYGWANQTVSIQAASSPDAPSGDTSRLAEFLDLFSKKLDFVPSHVDGDAIGDAYHGTFEDMLLKIQSTLAEDQMSTDAVLNNYTITADNIYTDRDGVSGVDLNDEATGLMTYQKAYTAACRLMNVLNEALDSLINGTV